MEQEIEKRVLVFTKQIHNSMVEETGIQPVRQLQLRREEQDRIIRIIKGNEVTMLSSHSFRW
jgi:hypothetical protein